MKKNCIVAQSGGPTVAINASLAGVIKEAIQSDCYETVYGSIHGIQGVFKREFLDLSKSSDRFIEQLKYTPAMYLGSCRYKLPDTEEDITAYETLFAIFEEMNIGAFFYIGGNDSMDTVAKLSKYAQSIGSPIRVVGIPKTIDNDLVGVDHTPGFGSAAKYIASSMREMAYDTYIYDLNSVLIVEIMGRDAGWLTAASALARNSFSKAPHLIYLPEVAFDKDNFIKDIQALMPTTKNIIIAVSEGIRDKNGNYISATTAAADKFGHAQLSGTGKCLELLVKERLGVKVRSVEINVLQRCAAHMASMADIDEAFLLGSLAVEKASEGHTAIMTGLVRTSNTPYTYELITLPVSEVANQAKEVPRHWINDSGNDVTSDMIDYIKPLLEGEVPTNYVDGVVDYLDVSHLIPDSN
ncbi:MAG: 6-phosphofructokinase [Lachnospiraceae bacterium]|nr:6-phosphofructokinase [Lachnospiraceae bacterium]